MKKILFALFAISMLVSCNNDDDSNTKQKFLTSVTIGGDTATFQYDEKKNLKSISSDGDVIYSFTYDNDNNLLSINDGDEDFVTVQYENGQLKSFTNGSALYPISYNAQTKKYIVTGANIEIGLAGKDLATIDEIGGANLLTMTYNADHKGPFYSVPTKNTFLYGLLLELHYFTSIRPISGVTEDGGTTYTTENTYDADGYVTGMVMKSGTQTEGTFTFQYSEL